MHLENGRGLVGMNVATSDRRRWYLRAGGFHLIAVIAGISFLARPNTSVIFVAGWQMAPTLPEKSNVKVDSDSYTDADPEMDDVVVSNPPLGRILPVIAIFRLN